MDMQRIRELFEAAVDLPAQQREALLEQACAGDPELKKEVRSLLRFGRSMDTGFRRLSDELAGQRKVLGGVERPGQRIGKYTLVEPIGTGGFSTVWPIDRKFN